MDEVTDKEGFTWVYNCGWRIKGSHPYRPPCEYINLNQPIGIRDFYKETGILPTQPIQEGETA